MQFLMHDELRLALTQLFLSRPMRSDPMTSYDTNHDRFCYLNTPSDKQVTDFILWQFESLWVKYDKAANDNTWSDNCARYESTIKGNEKRKEKNISSWQKMKLENVCERRVTRDVIEVSYHELTSTLLPTLNRIYAFLQIVPSTKMKNRFSCLEKESRKHRKNVHIELSEELKQVLRKRWAPYYAAFNYT